MRCCESNACCAQGYNAKLEQSNRKQKLNQELNHKCNPDELAKSYVQWKILAQSKQSSFSIADLFPIPPKTSIPQAILDCTPTALSAHAIGGGESL